MSEALRFLLVAELLGIAALPLAGAVLDRLPGRGYAFAKPLGLLLAAFPAWLAAHAGLLPFGTPLALLGALGLAAAGLVVARRRRPGATAGDRRLLVGAELVFAAAFGLYALVRAFAADVRGTEAPMDMAFLAAAHATESFPPADPWQSGEDLNYYYLGHYLMAFVVRLAGVAPDEGYNLALALLFALSAVAAYAVGSSLTVAAGGRRPVLTGVAAALAVCALGNLDAVRRLPAAEPELAAYPWFAPSRVVPDAITEFPAFSFLLGDLHAHVLAVPFTFLALGFALQAALTGPRARDVAPAGLVVGALYAINAWSYPVTLGLVCTAGLVGLRRPGAGAGAWAGRAAAWAGGVTGVSIVAFLPFWLTFDATTGGVGLVAERRPLPLFARDQLLLLGAFGWVLAAAAGRRRRGTGAVPASTTGRAAERFGWLLVAGGLACVLAPEVVYVRDEFDGSALFRMNTVFKLGYQAWLLLAVAAAATLPWGRAWLPAAVWRAWAAVALVLLALSALYPLVGAYARTGAFADGPRVAGDEWLRREAPGDVAAIAWLRARTPQDAVVAEAVGADYSTLGHARISTFSGRSSVLGWAGHERQWGHDPGRREADVRRLYRTGDVGEARVLLDRYGVDYVVVGPLERADHGDGGMDKFAALGTPVLERDGTTLWEIGRSGGR